MSLEESWSVALAKSMPVLVGVFRYCTFIDASPDSCVPLCSVCLVLIDKSGPGEIVTVYTGDNRWTAEVRDDLGEVLQHRQVDMLIFDSTPALQNPLDLGIARLKPSRQCEEDR